MDVWARKGNPALAISEDAARLDAAMVGSDNRTYSGLLPTGPSGEEKMWLNCMLKFLLNQCVGYRLITSTSPRI